MRVRRGSSGQEKEVKGAIVGRTAAKVRDLLANRSVGLRDHAYNLGFGKLRQEDYCKFEASLILEDTKQEGWACGLQQALGSITGTEYNSV